MNDPKVKQQIIDKIKDASNILVTVSNDPSVDELSAALGLTLLLNAMDKHATAVFSGQIPPAITFLDPEKTFEGTTDSLRDFIIALDKEKADHLRYKLEGDLVKIYITPYQTTITSDDLEFSQGDYNVELVIALGVENKDHLDAALEGHGKILHDATVVTLTAGEQVSNLGSIDWHDANASSLSEMLASLHEAMKLDKKLLDQSIATAWLTGIVSATERFSNTRTTSRVMTLAATLMSAGADQQLIAARLEEAGDTPETPVALPQTNSSGETKLTEGEPTKLVKEEAPAEPPKPKPNGELAISHEKKGTLEEVAEEVSAERLAASARAAERALEKQEELQQQEAAATPVDSTPRGAVSYTPSVAPPPQPLQSEVEPTFGGTLNATTEQAEEDKRREIENDKNKIILSHNYVGSQQTYNSPVNSTDADQAEPSAGLFGSDAPSEGAPIEPQSAPTSAAHTLTPPSEQPSLPPVDVPPSTPDIPVAQPTTPTLADIDAQNRAPAEAHDDARAAVEAALAAAPTAVPPIPEPVFVEPTPVATPVPVMPDNFDIPLPPPPPLPADFAGGLPPLPPMDPAVPVAPSPQPEILGAILNDQPAPSSPADPGQFKIPGQS